jgi:AhpD family alkylhydroperoxidase
MRLPPLPADQWDEAVQQSLAGMLPAERRNPRNAGNALSTFANHPALAKAFLRFNVHLLYSSTLPPRIRELAILRVAHRRDCAYEWAHHVTLAKNEGISDDEIAAVRRGEAADEFERAVLTGVDELDDKSQLSDQTWAALGERLDDRQRMDYVFTVGCYTLLAMAFNTFGVQLEQGH